MGIARRYKDPDEIVNFGIDWADYLGAETITSSGWNVPSDITEIAATFTENQAIIRIAGGVLGVTYRITNRITTSAEETVDQSIDIEVIEK